jgi:hypothetical protein
MLMAQFAPRVRKYVAFDNEIRPARRLKETLSALRIPRRRCEISKSDGWQGGQREIEAFSHHGAWSVVFIDPFQYQQQAEREGLCRLLKAPTPRIAPTILGIFNPATQSQDHGAWLDWSKVDRLIKASFGTRKWDCDTFVLRRGLQKGRRPHKTKDGLVQHYRLTLCSNEIGLVPAVRDTWNRDVANLPQWTDISG